MFGGWGATVTKRCPLLVDLLVRKLRKTFIRKFAAAGGSFVAARCPSASVRLSVLWSTARWRGRSRPNRRAFGAAPTVFPIETDLEYVAPKDRALSRAEQCRAC